MVYRIHLQMIPLNVKDTALMRTMLDLLSTLMDIGCKALFLTLYSTMHQVFTLRSIVMSVRPYCACWFFGIVLIAVSTECKMSFSINFGG